jgi:hypothetical protein
VKDSSDITKAKAFEDARLKYISTVIPGVTASTAVKFAALNRNRE